MTGEIVVVITIFKFKILSQDFVHSLSYQNCNRFYVLPFYFACFLISLLLVISSQSEGSFLHTVRPLSGNAENAFFQISLPSLHDYDDVRVPNFTLLGETWSTQEKDFLFLILDFEKVDISSWKICSHFKNWRRWDEICAIKRREFTFYDTSLWRSPSSLLKLPILTF